MINMNETFFGCRSLKELKLPKFKVNREINIIRMFGECSDELKMYIKSQYKNIGNEAFE